MPATARRYPASFPEGTDIYDIIKVTGHSYHANDPSVDLSQHRNIEQYKMYVGDTGLFVTMAFWDIAVTENIIGLLKGRGLANDPCLSLYVHLARIVFKDQRKNRVGR